MSDDLEAFNRAVDETFGVKEGPVRVPPPPRPPAYLEDEEGAPVASDAPELVDFLGENLKTQVLGEVVQDKTIFVPEMTTEELEEGKSPRGKYLKRIDIPDGVSTKRFRECLAAGYMQFVVEGEVTVEGIKQRTAYEDIPTRKLLASPEFQAALKARGVDVAGSSGLTPEQDYALQIILDPYDGLSMRRKLEKAKVSNSTFMAWRKNKLFAQHLERVSEQLMATSDVALIQLNQKVGDGDLNAIKYFLEMNGRYNPNDRAKVDIFVVMQQIMEVMARNIKDQSILMAIAGEMRTLAEGIQNDQNKTPRIGS